MSNYKTNLKDWGASGAEYPDSYSYEADVPPVDVYDNFLTSNLINDIQHLIGLTNSRVETDYGSTKPSSPETAHLFHDTDTGRLNTWNSTSSRWETSLRRSGDSMNGQLDLNGNNLIDGTGRVNVAGELDASNALYEAGNRAATRAWTNANADVPNADHADRATTADHLDELQAGGGVKSGVNNDRAYFAPYNGAGSPNYNREISYDPSVGEWDIEGTPLAGGQKIATRNWVNANADVPNADYANNADTLDGQHYSDIQNWVNGNADVPNADYADNAGDANTLDGQHYSDIQNWVNSSADVPNADHADQATQANNAEKVDGVNVYVQGSQPSNPSTGDIWIET